jgi:hypothetical protein
MSQQLRLQSPSLGRRWVVLMWRTRRLRWPLALWSMVPFAFLGLGPLAMCALLLLILSWFVPRPWCVRLPPGRRGPCFNPEGQRWLRQQLAPHPGARVYVLWSQEQWTVRSAALPWQPRPRFFARGPV